MIIGVMLTTGVSTLNGAQVEQGDVAQISRDHRVRAGSFTLLLIGKDGTEKYRRHQPTDPREIFALIDTMPMRITDETAP